MKSRMSSDKRSRSDSFCIRASGLFIHRIQRRRATPIRPSSVHRPPRICSPPTSHSSAGPSADSAKRRISSSSFFPSSSAAFPAPPVSSAIGRAGARKSPWKGQLDAAIARFYLISAPSFPIAAPPLGSTLRSSVSVSRLLDAVRVDLRALIKSFIAGVSVSESIRQEALWRRLCRGPANPSGIEWRRRRRVAVEAGRGAV